MFAGPSGLVTSVRRWALVYKMDVTSQIRAAKYADLSLVSVPFVTTTPSALSVPSATASPCRPNDLDHRLEVYVVVRRLCELLNRNLGVGLKAIMPSSSHLSVFSGSTALRPGARDGTASAQNSDAHPHRAYVPCRENMRCGCEADFEDWSGTDSREG